MPNISAHMIVAVEVAKRLNINSDEFNQHYNSMKFTDDKQAFMQGLVWAALLTVRIPHYYLKEE